MSKKIQIPNPIKVVETGTPTTENLVKGQVAIKEEDGKLVIFGNTGGEKIQSTAPQKYDYQKLISLTEESSDADIRAALTPIGGTEVVWPNIGDEIVVSKSGIGSKGFFCGYTTLPTKTELHFIFQLDLYYLGININDEYSITSAHRLQISSYSEMKDIVSTLKSTVTQQGTQIQSHTKDINGLHKMDVISDSVQVVFKQYMSRETGKEEKEFMIQAPKGMLSGEEKVKLYRKLATRYKVKEDIMPYEHRVKSGWIRYVDYKSGIESKNLYELEAVPFESSKPSYEYDFFRIRYKISPTKYSTFDKLLRSKCTLEMDEDTGTWKHVRIQNGRKVKKLLNYSNDLGFKIPVSFITWGVQLTTNKGEAYTPIMPFKVRYQMGNPAHQGKFTEKEAAEFTLDDLYISMSK